MFKSFTDEEIQAMYEALKKIANMYGGDDEWEESQSFYEAQMVAQCVLDKIGKKETLDK